MSRAQRQRVLKSCECAKHGWSGCGFCTDPKPVEVRDGDVWADDEGRTIRVGGDRGHVPSSSSVHVVVSNAKGAEFSGSWPRSTFGFPWYRLVSRKAVAA